MPKAANGRCGPRRGALDTLGTARARAPYSCEKIVAAPAATSPTRAKMARKATKGANATPKAHTAKRRSDGGKDKPSGLDAA